MAGDLNTRIIISARDQASDVFLRTAQNLGQVAAGAEKASAAMGGAMSTEVVARRVSELAGNLASLQKNAAVAAGDIRGLGVHFEKLSGQVAMPAKEFAALSERMLRVSSQKDMERSLRSIADAAALTARETRQLGVRLGATQDAIRNVTREMRGSVDAATLLKGGLTAVGAGLSLGAAYQSVKGITEGLFEAGVKAEQTRKAFEAITGSTGAAAKEFEFLRSTGDRLGQNFWDLTASYKTFSAAARESGFSLSETHKIFESVTKASATLGLSTEQTQRVFMAFQQIISKGTLSMEEVRVQLGETLPGALGIFAKAAGMAEDEFSKAVANGEIQSDILVKVADILGTRYPGELSKALSAQNKFNESWMDMKVKMADSGFLTSAATALGSVSTAISSPNVHAAMQSFAKNLGVLIERLGRFVELAALPSVSDTNAEASRLSSEGRLDITAYARLSHVERRRMVDQVLGEDAQRSGRGVVKAGTASAPVEEAPRSARYSLTQSEKTLQGVNLSPRDELNKSWAEGLKKIESIQKLVNKGTLSADDMGRALADQGVIWRSIGEAQEKFEKQGQKAGESAAKAASAATEAMQKAMAASAAWSGDEWGQKAGKLLAQLTQDLQSAKTPLEAYWARWEYGAKEATLVYEQWIDTLKRGGELEAQIGQLGQDPARQLAGERQKLSAEWQQAVHASAGNPQEIARVNELFALKEVELREKSLGDMARLDDAYWARRRQGLASMAAFLEQQGVDTHARAVYLAQQQDKLSQEYLDARIGTEETFSAYLADRLSQNYGLYKSAQGQMLDTWRQSADAMIKGMQGVADSVSWTFGQVFGDAAVGKLKSFQDYFSQFLAQMRQALAQFGTDLIKIGVDKALKGALGSFVGDGGSSGERGSYGMVTSQTVASMESAASSSGLLGAFAGTLGAQRVTAALPSTSAVSLLLGEDAASGLGGVSRGAAGSTTGGFADSFAAWTAGMSGASLAASSSDTFRASTGTRLVTLGGVSYAVAADGSMAPVGSATGSTTVVQAQQQQGSSSNWFTDLIKGSLGKESGWVQSLNQWGYDNFGLGSLVSSYSSGALGQASTAFSSGINSSGMTGYQALQAGDQAAVSSLNSAGLSSSVTGGLGTAVSGALTGAGIGYGVSSLIYPNGTGTLGGTLGGALGGAAGSALLGTALGSFAGPVGAIVGAIGGSLLTGSTTSETSLTGDTGATVILSSPLTSSLTGWASNRTTTSGLMGSSETTHNKQWTNLDPELSKAWYSAWTKDSSNVRNAAQDLGMDLSSWSTYSFPMAFDINESVAAQASSNVATNMSQVVITANNLKSAFDDVARSGEDYYTELKRISESYAAGSLAANMAGTSLATLADSLNVVYQGAWVSEAADVMGSLEDVTAAFSTLQTYTMTDQEQWSASMTAYASKAGTAIAQLGVAGVTLENFWDQYEAAAASGMSTEDFADWANAAQYVAQFSSLEQQAIQLMQSANSTRMSSLQAELTILNTQKVMVNGMLTTVSSAYSTYSGLADSLESTLQGLSWNTTLSGKTNKQVVEEMGAHYNKLLAKVQGEDASSLTYSADVSALSSFSSTYLARLKDYLGPSSAYYNIYDSVTGTLQGLESTTQSESEILLKQLEQQVEAANKIQEQVDQLTIANANLAILAGSVQTAGQSIAAALATLGVDSSYTDAITAAVAVGETSQSSTSAAVAASQASTSSESSWTAADAQALYEALSASMYGTSSTASASLDYLGGYASGGEATGPGWMLVGENGPEPILLGRGQSASVRSNKELREAVGQDNEEMISVSKAGFSAIIQELRELRSMNVRTASALERLTSRLQ